MWLVMYLDQTIFICEETQMKWGKYYLSCKFSSLWLYWWNACWNKKNYIKFSSLSISNLCIVILGLIYFLIRRLFSTLLHEMKVSKFLTVSQQSFNSVWYWSKYSKYNVGNDLNLCILNFLSWLSIMTS